MQDAKSGLVASPFRIRQNAFPRRVGLLYNMRLVTLELSCLLGTGTVSKSGSVCVRTCVDSEGFWPAQFCVQFRADCPLHVAASLLVTSASCRYCSAVVQILTHGIMTVLLHCITRPDGKTVFMETARGQSKARACQGAYCSSMARL